MRAFIYEMWIFVDVGKILGDKLESFESDSLAHGVVERGREGFEAVGEGVESCAGGDVRG